MSVRGEKEMTDYRRYTRENEDSEEGYDPDATECEDCGVEFTMDEVICEACDGRREATLRLGNVASSRA